ncbi:hypothetical protein GCM10027049_10810 [Mucilaginibacter puniceus]
MYGKQVDIIIDKIIEATKKVSPAPVAISTIPLFDFIEATKMPITKTSNIAHLLNNDTMKFFFPLVLDIKISHDIAIIFNIGIKKVKQSIIQ